METENNKDVGGPVVFAVTLAVLVISIIWALS
jgi:hypothetical protein